MKKILFTLILVFSFQSSALADTYTDVNEAHNYFSAIEFITNEGIVGGYSDGSYKPYNTLNRAELLKIVIESVYADEFEDFSSESCFSDVPQNEWYTGYVCFAKNEGIVDGYNDGTFKPDQKILFVEALKITLKAFKIDYSQDDPWYKDIVIKASDKNLIPLSISYFDEDFSRGQMAELITRVLKNNSGELDSYLGDKKNTRATYEIMKNNTDNRLVFTDPDLCYYDDTCSSDEVCLRNTCTPKSHLYPQNKELSEQYCAYDEVYINGECKKAKFAIAYLGNSLDDEQEFNSYVEELIFAIAAGTGMSNCPEYIRVHTYFDELCLPTNGEIQGENIDKALFEKIGGELQFMVLYPEENVTGDFTPQCSTFIGTSSFGGFLTMGSGPLVNLHETGHKLGLWDQYCYLPNSKNPNIVDFEEALCREAETDWYREYCGREDFGQTEDNAFQCEGDLNEYGVASLMGHSGFNNLEDSYWGFTEAEQEYISETLNCY
jgi:hypothetical protein